MPPRPRGLFLRVLLCRNASELLLPPHAAPSTRSCRPPCQQLMRPDVLAHRVARASASRFLTAARAPVAFFDLLPTCSLASLRRLFLRAYPRHQVTACPHSKSSSLSSMRITGSLCSSSCVISVNPSQLACCHRSSATLTCIPALPQLLRSHPLDLCARFPSDRCASGSAVP